MHDAPQPALVSARACVRDPDGITVYVRAHRVSVGPPMSFDVREPQVTAVEHFLAAVAADLLGSLQRQARRQRIVVDRLEASLHGVVADPLAWLGVVGESGTPRLESVSIRVFVDSPADPPCLDSLWSAAAIYQ